MIINLLPMCYHASHDPFANIGPPSCQTVDSEKPASKLIRAVLRVSEIDPQTWTQYSIHRCYCKSKGKEKDELEHELDSSRTLDQLGIKEGHSIFFRKRENRVDEMEEDQDKIPQPPSRKRKERSEDDVTSQSSLLPSAPTPKSNLENLTSRAARAARSISKLLGGDAWKTQSIGKLGPIATKSVNCLAALLRAVKTSLQIPQVVTVGAGLFNSNVVEALIRSFHQRLGSSVVRKGERHFFDLGVSDYEKANELLKGKLKGDGTWEKSSLAHLEDSAFSQPISRFPLSDSGLSGHSLNTARTISALWGNELWLTEAPLPGLSPITLRSNDLLPILRQIAQLTRVKSGGRTSNGMPSDVLLALKEAIEKLEMGYKGKRGKNSSHHGWNQAKALPLALEILKRNLKAGERSVGTSTSSGSASVSRGEGKSDSGRSVRRKIGGKK